MPYDAHNSPDLCPSRSLPEAVCAKGPEFEYKSELSFWAGCGQIVGTEWALNEQCGQKPVLSEQKALLSHGSDASEPFRIL